MVMVVDAEGVEVVVCDEDEEVLDSLSSFALNLCGGSLVICQKKRTIRFDFKQTLHARSTPTFRKNTKN